MNAEEPVYKLVETMSGYHICPDGTQLPALVLGYVDHDLPAASPKEYVRFLLAGQGGVRQLIEVLTAICVDTEELPEHEGGNDK